MGKPVQLTEAIVFEREDCISCGITFFVPDYLQKGRRLDKQAFYCPNGHSMVYGKNEVDALRKKVKEWEDYAENIRKRKEWAEQEAKNQRERAEATERRLSAQFGENTKLRNRIKNGVCPCCTRSFTNLRRHMATKHPGFKAESAT